MFAAFFSAITVIVGLFKIFSSDLSLSVEIMNNEMSDEGADLHKIFLKESKDWVENA